MRALHAGSALHAHPVTVILRHSFEPVDNERLASMCGVLDEQLRRIEEALPVTIRHRRGSFEIEGRKGDAQRALGVLEQLHDRSPKALSPQAVQLLLTEAAASPPAGRARADAAKAAATTAKPNGEADAERNADVVLHTRRSDLKARTPNQRRYLRAILDPDHGYRDPVLLDYVGRFHALLAEADAAWGEEIQRRLRALDDGTAKLVTADEVHAEARKLYR